MPPRDPVTALPDASELLRLRGRLYELSPGRGAPASPDAARDGAAPFLRGAFGDASSALRAAVLAGRVVRAVARRWPGRAAGIAARHRPARRRVGPLRLLGRHPFVAAAVALGAVALARRLTRGAGRGRRAGAPA